MIRIIFNENKEILLQQRSMKKKNFPGVIDAAATGHVDAGESTKTGAVREIQEELGIDISEEKLDFVGEFLAEDEWEFRT